MSDEPLRMLIIEADDSDFLLARRALEASDVARTVSRAVRGDDAIAQCQTDGIDVVLTEYRLPDIDGLEVFRRLHAQKVAAPVVMVTRAGSEALVVEALKLGLEDYVAKDAEGAYLGRLPQTVQEARWRWENRQAFHVEQAQLVAREKAYREMVQTANSIILRFDRQGNVTFFNEFAQRFFGYSEAQILGRNVVGTIVPKTDASGRDLEAMIRDIVRSPEAYVTNENENLCSDGRRVYIAWTNRAIRDESGRVTEILSVGNDQTERKRVEQELEKFKSIADNANYGVAIASLEGDLLYVNAYFARIHGYAPEELIGKHLSVFHTGEQMTLVRSVNQELRDTGGYSSQEVWHRRKDGSTFPMLMNGVIVRDARGRPSFIAATATDITERKRADEQLRRYAEELKHSNEEVKKFAYIVSHDLRAPLVNLKGFAGELRLALDTIKTGMGPALRSLDQDQRATIDQALNEDIPEALSFIDSSIVRMEDLTNAVLKLSRLGRMELKPERIDMTRLVQNTLDTLEHQIEERQAQVTVEPLDDVVADRIAMEQTMGNLLANAVLYLAPGRPGCIRVFSRRGQDDTTFVVEDNGRGIAEEEMPKVFTPFRRAGTQDVPGEGMGLAYVQTLIHRQGGRIWCESEVGVGTKFGFTIPNQPAAVTVGRSSG